jgi:hypothetical protein
MFDIIARKITDDELLETIRKMREGSRSEKNKAFVDLRDTYQGLLRSRFNKVKSIASNPSEMEQLNLFIESVFVEILMEKGLRFDSVPQIKKYFTDQLTWRISPSNVEEELGKSSIMKDVSALKTRFRRALSRYIKKFKKRPNLIKNREDIKNFADEMGVEPEKIMDILKAIGPHTIKSIFDEISTDDSSAEILLDTLKSKEPLPDKVLKDKEFMRILKGEIKKLLSEDELNVFMEYYHPDDLSKKRPSREELAKKLDIPHRTVRDILDRKIREKLLKSPKLKEFAKSSMIKRFVMYAMNKYGFEKMTSVDYENMI